MGTSLTAQNQKKPCKTSRDGSPRPKKGRKSIQVKQQSEEIAKKPTPQQICVHSRAAAFCTACQSNGSSGSSLCEHAKVRSYCRLCAQQRDGSRPSGVDGAARIAKWLHHDPHRHEPLRPICLLLKPPVPTVEKTAPKVRFAPEMMLFGECSLPLGEDILEDVIMEECDAPIAVGASAIPEEELGDTRPISAAAENGHPRVREQITHSHSDTSLSIQPPLTESTVAEYSTSNDMVDTPPILSQEPTFPIDNISNIIRNAESETEQLQPTEAATAIDSEDPKPAEVEEPKTGPSWPTADSGETEKAIIESACPPEAISKTGETELAAATETNLGSMPPAREMTRPNTTYPSTVTIAIPVVENRSSISVQNSEVWKALQVVERDAASQPYGQKSLNTPAVLPGAVNVRPFVPFRSDPFPAATTPTAESVMFGRPPLPPVRGGVGLPNAASGRPTPRPLRPTLAITTRSPAKGQSRGPRTPASADAAQIGTEGAKAATPTTLTKRQKKSAKNAGEQLSSPVSQEIRSQTQNEAPSIVPSTSPSVESNKVSNKRPAPPDFPSTGASVTSAQPAQKKIRTTHPIETEIQTAEAVQPMEKSSSGGTAVTMGPSSVGRIKQGVAQVIAQFVSGRSALSASPPVAASTNQTQATLATQQTIQTDPRPLSFLVPATPAPKYKSTPSPLQQAVQPDSQSRLNASMKDRAGTASPAPVRAAQQHLLLYLPPRRSSLGSTPGSLGSRDMSSSASPRSASNSGLTGSSQPTVACYDDGGDDAELEAFLDAEDLDDEGDTTDDEDIQRRAARPAAPGGSSWLMLPPNPVHSRPIAVPTRSRDEAGRAKGKEPEFVAVPTATSGNRAVPVAGRVPVKFS